MVNTTPIYDENITFIILNNLSLVLISLDADKKQIDLIVGDEYKNNLVEYYIGLKEIKSYKIDKEF